MRPYLKNRVVADVTQTRTVGWTLIENTQCPYEKTEMWTPTPRVSSTVTEAETGARGVSRHPKPRPF